VIVDASVVVKWFALEALHDAARNLLTARGELVAPDILVIEFANAMWVKVGRGELDEHDALPAIAAVSGGGEPALRSSAPLARRAFALARLLDHPVYDCVYLALAEQLEMPLITADARFVAAAHPEAGDRVRLLGT
jgi:predicted nucleic acid-binding protein